MTGSCSVPVQGPKIPRGALAEEGRLASAGVANETQHPLPESQSEIRAQAQKSPPEGAGCLGVADGGRSKD